MHQFQISDLRYEIGSDLNAPGVTGWQIDLSKSNLKFEILDLRFWKP